MKAFAPLSALVSAILISTLFATSFAASFITLTATSAHAQTSTIASVAEKKEPAIAVPKHTCAKPVMPEKFTSGAQQDEFQKSVEIFRTCLMDYRNQMQRAAESHVQSGNAAAGEFNEYIKELNAANEKK